MDVRPGVATELPFWLRPIILSAFFDSPVRKVALYCKHQRVRIIVVPLTKKSRPSFSRPSRRRRMTAAPFSIVNAATDAELRQRVEALLQAHDDPGSFLDAPTSFLDPLSTIFIAEEPETVIGPYKLLEHIGEGGFGTVYMAEQQEPVRRRWP